MMDKFFQFLRGPEAPILGVFALVLGYFQMYAKLYYQHAPQLDFMAIDVSVALVVSTGLSLGTIVLVVQTNNLRTPALFSLLDLIAGIFYFRVLEKDWKQALPGILISLMSAAIVFALGELFVRRIRQRQAQKEEAQEVREKLTAEFAKLRKELTEANEGLTQTNAAYKQQIATLEASVAEREIALSNALNQAKELNGKLSEAESLFLELKEASEEWRLIYDKEMARRDRLSKSKR